MARFTVELPLIGVQVVPVEDKIYAKVFVGEQPDGVTERVTSVMVMPIKDGHAPEIFAAAEGMHLGQIVRLHVDTARGGKQSVRNEVFHIEPVVQSVKQTLDKQGVTAPVNQGKSA